MSDVDGQEVFAFGEWLDFSGRWDVLRNVLTGTCRGGLLPVCWMSDGAGWDSLVVAVSPRCRVQSTTRDMAADGVARFDYHTALLWCRVMTVGGIGDGGLEMSGVAELQHT